MQDVEQYQNPAETFKRDKYSYSQEGKYNGYNPLFAGNQQAPGRGADWNWLAVYFSTAQSSLQSGATATGSRLTNASITGLFLPDMTLGSVFFAGAGGQVSQDNANFFWDDTNNLLELKKTTVFSPSLRFGSAQALTYEAANSTGLRNGTNAQTFSVYNTFTAGTPDYERLEFNWSTVANKCIIRTVTSGTGTARNLAFRTSNGGGDAILITSSASNPIDFFPSSTFSSYAGSLRLLSGSTINVTSGTLIPAQITGTFADAGVNSTSVVYGLNISATVNYTGAAKTGKVYLQYFNPTLTSQPSGRNTGIAFSSAFTSSTFPSMRWFNTADEDTNAEWMECGWHAVANNFVFKTNTSGAGTVRSVIFRYGSTNTNAMIVSGALSGGVSFLNSAVTNTLFPGGIISIGPSSTLGGTSGTNIGVLFPSTLTFQDGGTNSSTVVNVLAVQPTINYSAATKTGKVYGIYLAPTLTAQPTGNNAGLVFSSAFTSSTFPALALYNTADEDTNWERFETGWHVTANNYVLRTQKGGTGTARTMTLCFGGSSTSAVIVPNSSATGVTLNTGSTSGTSSIAATIGASTFSIATSGTSVGLKVLAGPAPTATSTMAWYGISLDSTINYSAGTPGAGYAYMIYLNPTLTALPTGFSAAMALSSAASTLGGITFNNQTDEQTNYEKALLYFSSNQFTISTIAGGTGTAREVALQPGGSPAWNVSTTGIMYPAGTLATNMNNGFLNIPGAAGAPTGVPAVTTGFAVYWDSNANKLRIYSGGVWKTSSLFT